MQTRFSSIISLSPNRVILISVFLNNILEFNPWADRLKGGIVDSVGQNPTGMITKSQDVPVVPFTENVVCSIVKSVGILPVLNVKKDLFLNVVMSISATLALEVQIRMESVLNVERNRLNVLVVEN